MISVPKSYNYISAFLTFACNMNCSYCINKSGELYDYTPMSGAEWIKGLNNIENRDIPITLSGGEPTVHPDFYDIANGVERDKDLLTNGNFNVDYFIKNIKYYKFYREHSPYACIRFSYHPGITNLRELLDKAKYLKNRGYLVGIWAVKHPDYEDDVDNALRIAEDDYHLDFRIKEYLSSTHGTYKYPEALDGVAKSCECKPSELLIAPDGRLFRCHRDLYAGENSYGHILFDNECIPSYFMPCDNMGQCNPCDIKQKFNRFQEEGHCSVEIKL